MRAADTGRFRYNSDIASRDRIRHRRIRLPVKLIQLDFKYADDSIEDIDQVVGGA